MTPEQFIGVVRPELDRLHRDQDAALQSLREEIKFLEKIAAQRRETIDRLYAELRAAYGLTPETKEEDGQ